VWHTSVSGFGLSLATRRAKALQVLDGVGDAALGQWEELGDGVLHMRRRLTVVEAARVGDVRDVRGTPEAVHRFQKVQRYLPAGWTEID